MSRAIGMLSILKITALIKAKQKGMHCDGGGLYFRIDPRHGGTSWVFRYRDKVSLKLRDKGMGRFPDLSLKDARHQAAQLRTLRAQGVDPIDSKRQILADQRARLMQAKTFGQCAESFYQKEQHGWSKKTRQKWRQSIDHNFKSILKKPVQEVSSADIIEILKPIWFETTYTATRVRGRLESIIEHAKELKVFTGDNPAVWRGSLRAHFPKPSDISQETHHPALPYMQAPAFMEKLISLNVFNREGTLSVKSLALALLTGCRIGEVVAAQWKEFDLEAMLWTIPKERMKSGEQHVVPISPAVAQILHALIDSGSGYVFPSNKTRNGKNAPITIAAPYKLLKEIEPNYTVHGLRATFRSWAGAMTDYPEEITEAALAHKPKDKVKAAYMRDKLVDKRRHLMNDWADYCLKQPIS